MKIIRSFSFFLLSVSALFFVSACSPQKGVVIQAPPPGSFFNTIIDIEESDGGNVSVDNNVAEKAAQIPLEENEELVEIFEINLDNDQDLEQILIIRVNSGNANHLQLRILDYLGGTNQFEFVFTQELEDKKINSVAINVDDLTQDRENEIIFSAFNDKGYHILKVLSLRPSSYRLNVRMIFDKKVDGLMEIAKIYNDDNNSEILQQNIVAQINNDQDDNPWSIIRETYVWDKLRTRYVMTTRESVVGVDVKEDRVRNVMDSNNPSLFEEYLEGPWYREVRLESALSGTENSEDIIFFEPEKSALSFFSGGILETYLWKSSQKNVPSKLYISATNSLRYGLPRNISVTLQDYDTISLRTIVSQGDRDWDGTYKRLNENLINAYRKKMGVNSLLENELFSGIFESTSGQDIYFDLPHFGIYNEQKKIKSGSAALFRINGDLVLQLKTINPNGLIVSRDSYLVDFRELINENSIIRTLTLKQGTLSVDGIRADLRKEHTYEQIEIVNQDS